MSYLKLFENAAEFVKARGVEVTFERGRPIKEPAIAQQASRSNVPLPQSLLDLYREVGDGLFFRWSAGDRTPFAAFEIPSLEKLVDELVDKPRWTTEWSDSHDFRYTDDPQLARQTALRMRHWIEFISEGNGDSFSLDTSRPGVPVLFNEHDWFDGGTGDNGHVVAASLLDFLNDWSGVCFQQPAKLLWPSVYQKPKGIQWESDEFSPLYRLRST